MYSSYQRRERNGDMRTKRKALLGVAVALGIGMGTTVPY